MPPKPAQGKKGKEEQEDFSDVPTLPTLNSFLFSLLYKNFPTQEIREKLIKYVSEKIPQDRVKILTREEIITYGKTKQIILEPNVIPTIPQDDPRLKMSEDEQIAKAACDRLFELSVYARRAKKEKIQKLEEAAKLQQENTIQSLDSDELDIMFQIIDYPQSKSESLAFAKYGNTVNCIFDINFINQPPLEDDETVDEQVRDQFPMNISDQELLFTQKIIEKIQNLKDARACSVKKSNLRNQAFIEIPYYHYPKLEQVKNEQGEETIQRKEPETIFQVQFYKQLERYGSMYIKYLRFKQRVKTIPLHTDKDAVRELEYLEQSQKEFQQWQQQVAQILGQDTLTQTQKEKMDASTLEKYNQDKEQRQFDIENEKQQRLQEYEQANYRIQILNEKLKVSIDDTKDYSKFNLDVYFNDFMNNKEASNSVASIMSSMITQLTNKSEIFNLEDGEKNTDADSLDDMFSSFAKDVNTSLKITDINQQEERQFNQYSQFLDPTPNVSKPKRQGTEAFAVQKTDLGEIEYYEELDKARRALLKLQKEEPISDIEKAEDIYLREKQIINNLIIPGSDRHLMPPVPTKSQRLRDSENPQIYPFCTLPVEDAERALILKAFQELIKNQLIEEEIEPQQRHQKYKVFGRNYEAHMKAEVMRQVIADAFLQEPDMATMYYQRNDSLLVALYNKVIIDQNEEEIDGKRQWQASYRVMPDFENWLKYFADQLLVPSSSNKTEQQVTIQKLQFDEEMIPDQMYDIDDQKISNIEETSEMLYPEHNAIMRVDNFQIGGQQFKKSVIIKDTITFGLRQAKQEIVSDSEKEYGLASYKKIGDTELWMHFSNETKLLVETIQIMPNEQKLIRIDPPKPTPEQIAAKEEAIKQAQLAAAKNKGKNNSQLGNIAQIEEQFKEPEPTWEPEPLNFLDTYFNQYREESVYGPMITTTFTNGLIIKHLFNGEICQTIQDNILRDDTQEIDRVIVGKGVIIRHLRNKDAEVLFPNGYKSYFDRYNMMWVTTNNKGMKRAQKDGIEWDLEPIPCAIETDAVTNARVLIREDNVMTIQYQDGSLYCQHSDGTQIRTNSDESEIRIEKEGFAPIQIKIGNPKDIPTKEENIENISAIQRSLDGIVKETYMPDGTIVETFLDLLDYQTQEVGIRHLYKKQDFSVIIADQNGNLSIISSNERSALNENGLRSAMGKDTDYTSEFCRSQRDKFTNGVFYATILPQNSFILSSDDKFQYILNSNFKLYKQRFNEQDDTNNNDQSLQDQTIRTNYDDGREIEDIICHKSPFTKHFIYPRLFVIKPDGSGHELLAKEQLEYYFRVQKSREECLKQRKVVMIGSTSAKSLYYLTKVKTLHDKEQEMLLFKTQTYPQNARYAIERIQNKQVKHDEPTSLITDQYVFRQIFEFQELDTYKQEIFYDDLLRFKQWKLNQVRYDTEFGIVHMATKDQVLDMNKIEDDYFVAKRINQKILNARRNKKAKFNPEEFKKQFIRTLEKNEEMSEYQRRTTQYERNDSIRSGIQSSQEQNLNKQPSNNKIVENSSTLHEINQENWRLKKKASAEAKVKQKLADIHLMINTPTFIPNYFKSKEGLHFTRNHPAKPPSTEVIMRMSQRINRSQQNSEKAQSHYDGFSQKSASHSPQNQVPNDISQRQDGGDDKDNPIVALEPEQNLRQGSMIQCTKKSMQNNAQPEQPQPSLYIQEKMYLQQKEQEHLLKAEEYHVVKTKDFNVIGRLRQEKPFVKSIVMQL